jgi:quaternary ammonium compound-resistance protein SugE
MTAWIHLFIAGLLEIVWAIGLKHTQGFSRLWPSVGTIAAMIASFFLLARALQTLPVGTAYAVWTGIGAAGTALLGMAFLGESRDAPRLLCIALIIAGVIGLKTFSHDPTPSTPAAIPIPTTPTPPAPPTPPHEP